MGQHWPNDEEIWYKVFISDGNYFCFTRIEPVGVCGQIIPVSGFLFNSNISICFIVTKTVGYKTEYKHAKIVLVQFISLDFGGYEMCPPPPPPPPPPPSNFCNNARQANVVYRGDIVKDFVQHWFMSTSSNGNIFRVTGPLCGEFTGHRWIPRTNGQ